VTTRGSGAPKPRSTGRRHSGNDNSIRPPGIRGTLREIVLELARIAAAEDDAADRRR
jgi:hypothetical protein